MKRISKNQLVRVIFNGRSREYTMVRVGDIENQCEAIQEAFRHLVNLRKTQPAVGLTYNYDSTSYLQISL